MDPEVAEKQLIAELASRVDAFDPHTSYSEDLAREFIEWLYLEGQDIVAALHEQPSRWWFMERDNTAPKSPPVWLGGDEFDNRTLVLWWPGSRWLIVSLSLRLKRELMK